MNLGVAPSQTEQDILDPESRSLAVQSWDTLFGAIQPQMPRALAQPDEVSFKLATNLLLRLVCFKMGAFLHGLVPETQVYPVPSISQSSLVCDISQLDTPLAESPDDFFPNSITLSPYDHGSTNERGTVAVTYVQCSEIPSNAVSCDFIVEFLESQASTPCSGVAAGNSFDSPNCIDGVSSLAFPGAADETQRCKVR